MINKLFFLLVFLVAPFVNAQHSEKSLQLMPWPQEINMGQGSFVLGPDFVIGIPEEADNSSRVYQGATSLIRNLSDRSGVFFEIGFPQRGKKAGKNGISIHYEKTIELGLGMDESYSLSIGDNGIVINSSTDVGALRAMSTVAQLLTVTDGGYVFPYLTIKDFPRFAWRGLMLDPARHFLPVDVVKRNLDAMAYVKMNIMHWHLSDDQGFRIESKKLPKLHELGSDGLYYTQNQIKEVVAYANSLGIRVMPEIDVPGHATAILTAYPEFASKQGIDYELERHAGIMDPTLNPINEGTYEFLDTLFGEIAPLFPDVYFHIGGDENLGKHWNENADIQAFMKKNDIKDNHELQTYFNIKLQKILNKYGKSLMGWEEIMTENMPTTALIHSWRGVNEGVEAGGSLVKAAKNGYKTILSNGYYIDLLYSVDEHYLVDPMPKVSLSEEEAARILGGEATMWGELVTYRTVDSRIWPRTAAIAERYWSNANIVDLDELHRRLPLMSNQLEAVGSRHLQIREALFRNISNFQSTEALESLAAISEPFKRYSRNAGGKEYKSYSPFTLFADACTADAPDKRPFDQLTASYLSSNGNTGKAYLINYLNKWAASYDELKAIQNQAPLVARILPYSKRVAEISEAMINGLEKGSLTKEEASKMETLLASKEDPKINIDVEFAASHSIKQLVDHLKK